MTKLVSWKDEKLTRGLVGVYIRGDKVMLYSVLPVTMAKQTLVQEHATKVLNYALMQVIYSHYFTIKLNLSQGTIGKEFHHLL